MGTLLCSCVEVRELINLLLRMMSRVGQEMGVSDESLCDTWRRGGFGSFFPFGLKGIFFNRNVFDFCIRTIYCWKHLFIGFQRNSQV